MGTSCCHASESGQQKDVVEELPHPNASVAVVARLSSKASETKGKVENGSADAPTEKQGERDTEKKASKDEEDDEEQAEKLSSLSSFATVSFYGSEIDPNAVISLMKQRSCELLEDCERSPTVQERPSQIHLLKKRLSRGNSMVSGKPNFSGVWKCIDTWNLDQFLQACGVNKIQRMAACKAPWPWWSMEQEADKIHYINHGPLGDVAECIDLTGEEYVSYDGRKQKMTNKASWEKDTLVIMRDGPLGIFREERTLGEDNTLTFRLTIQSGPNAGGSWGRKFQRADDLFHKETAGGTRKSYFR